MAHEREHLQYNVHEAKTNFSKLMAAAEAGADVVVARNGTPVVRLVRIQPVDWRAAFGSLRDAYPPRDDDPSWIGGEAEPLSREIWAGTGAYDDGIDDDPQGLLS